DGAIHRAAGPELLGECKTLNGCKTGQAKKTGGYKLPSKNVIHTVGPRGEKPDLLQSCYEQSLEIALKENLRSVAFPCISTGIYGYPQEAAALIALKTVRTILEKNSDNFDRNKIVFLLVRGKFSHIGFETSNESFRSNPYLFMCLVKEDLLISV
ncbi:hypothetical protein GE061_010032, partial [Apolygus lucorum]